MSSIHTRFTYTVQDEQRLEVVGPKVTQVRLVLDPSEPPVLCTLSLTDCEGNLQSFTRDREKDRYISFSVQLGSEDGKHLVSRLKESLNTDSIRIQVDSHTPYPSKSAAYLDSNDDTLQPLLKDLACLWVDSFADDSTPPSSTDPYLRRYKSFSSSTTSAPSTPLLTPAMSSFGPWIRPSRASQSSLATSASSSGSAYDYVDTDAVYLDMQNNSESSTPPTPLSKRGSDSFRSHTIVAYEDGSKDLLSKLAAIELEQLKLEEQQQKITVQEIDIVDTPSLTERSASVVDTPSLTERSAASSSIAVDEIQVVDREKVEDPSRDLILPSRERFIIPPRRSIEEPSVPDAVPASPEVVFEKPEPEAAVTVTVEPASPWWRVFGAPKIVHRAGTIVTSADVPAIILPSPPTDDEKFLYAQTRRVPLYIFGTLSFLSVSVGMWFFAVSSQQFYWFGAFVGLIQIYLIISYIVGYAGRDYDLDAHKKILADHPLTVQPTVDIYLPCCKEPLEVLENTYKYVSQLDYDKYKVYVLDDGGLESVKCLAEQYKFNYISRDNKPHLKKAGNLRYAFTRTEGDFFAIFDADFCPRRDFLREILPIMASDEKVAIVQSPQFFRPSAEQTWVEQGASATQELFYRIVQVNRDRWGASICVGSNAVYRRGALAEVGGTAEIGHSEDVHTGFYALTRGWKLKYIPLALACGVSPDTPKAFFSQQMRWCSGSTTLLTNPEFWRSQLSVIQKICFMSGMMYYSAAALMIFLTPLPGLLMLWIKPDLVLFYNFAYAFPSLIYSVIVFRLWSRQRYNFNVNFVFVIQQYAYLMAVKDRLLGTTASWVPSGDTKSHDGKKKVAGGNNKYRNMRLLCSAWIIGTTVAVIVGSALRIAQGHKWYNFLPLLILDTYNLFIAHKFILFS